MNNEIIASFFSIKLIVTSSVIMLHLNSDRALITKSSQIMFAIITLMACFAFGFHLRPAFLETESKRNRIYLSNAESKENTFTSNQKIIHSFPPVSNLTHLWSMRLADENYFRLAHLLPCRIVKYIGGPNIDKIDSCDHSSMNEYSLENTLQAQKWLYEHQHPVNCTNRKFAIIQHFARAGFGATIHSITWAFGMALAENRIAIYEAPGNWVRQIDIIEIDRKISLSLWLITQIGKVIFLIVYKAFL